MLTESTSVPYASDDIEPSDRSMLVLQYLTALVAAIAAVVLAQIH
jgi:hypothetical protein